MLRIVVIAGLVFAAGGTGFGFGCSLRDRTFLDYPPRDRLSNNFDRLSGSSGSVDRTGQRSG